MQESILINKKETMCQFHVTCSFFNSVSSLINIKLNKARGQSLIFT
jgi:hypothetical protein